MAINHELNTYIGKGCNMLEDVEFEGLTPKVTEAVGAIGTGENAKLFEVESLGRGVDAIEVPDFAGLMEDAAEEGGDDQQQDEPQEP